MTGLSALPPPRWACSWQRSRCWHVLSSRRSRMQQIRSIAVLLGLALALSLGSLAYEQVRTQRAKDTATIERLRQQLSEESEAHRRALAATSSLPAARPATGGTLVTGAMGGTTFGALPGAAPPPGAAPAPGAVHSFIHTIDTLPYSKGDLVMMSFATGGVRDMLDNWVRHVRMLGLPILVAAMDDEVLGRCNAERFDCYSCVQPQEEVPRYIRGDFSGFRALGVRKVDALLPILRRGVHVVLSDVDCVWLHDPNPMVRGLVPGYEDFAHADLIVSTDCHNPRSDYDSDGCFGELLDKNTGLTLTRTLTVTRTLAVTLTLSLTLALTRRPARQEHGRDGDPRDAQRHREHGRVARAAGDGPQGRAGPDHLHGSDRRQRARPPVGHDAGHACGVQGVRAGLLRRDRHQRHRLRQGLRQ